MTRADLVNSMFSGKAITIPMTDGYGSFKGRVMSMTKEDGTGHSWLVTIQLATPYRHRNTKLYVRTLPGSYACRLISIAV